LIRVVFTAVVTLVVGCTSFPTAATNPDAGGGGGPPDLEPPPSYTTLFDTLFDVGTPGHCATAGCHADPGHPVWLCGTTKERCYQGMVGAGLVSTTDPMRSLIADPANSPLSWINPNGPMPFDGAGPNPTARAMIVEWVAAGAHDD
jgi:hypothetical protein